LPGPGERGERSRARRRRLPARTSRHVRGATADRDPDLRAGAARIRTASRAPDAGRRTPRYCRVRGPRRPDPSPGSRRVTRRRRPSTAVLARRTAAHEVLSRRSQTRRSHMLPGRRRVFATAMRFRVETVMFPVGPVPGAATPEKCGTPAYLDEVAGAPTGEG